MSDFGEILERWEREGAHHPRHHHDEARESLERWLDDHDPPDKDRVRSESRSDSARNRGRERARLRALPPQATIDLHGKTVEQAHAALRQFLAESRDQGLEKVLIVHGKGNHSPSGREAVLSGLVRRVLEECEWTGESGFADRNHGGAGATWVVLRRRPAGGAEQARGQRSR